MFAYERSKKVGELELPNKAVYSNPDLTSTLGKCKPPQYSVSK